jgi:Zn ribbon nucleic-acid-binding protein
VSAVQCQTSTTKYGCWHRLSCFRLDVIYQQQANIRQESVRGVKAMSYIVWSRKCRKCKGQFYLEDNEDGHYLVCIQCGFSEKVVDKELVTLLGAIQTTRKKDLSKV